MNFAKLQKYKRIIEQYPKPTARESASDREYEQYLDSLSEQELTELIHGKLEESRNTPEGIAREKRLEGMSEEELIEELQRQLKAS